MPNYHIIIQQERRTEPERMAIPISRTLSTEQPDTYLVSEPQLHHMGSLPENIDDEQFVMVVEWDGISPYVIQHKGDYSARTMEYAGWPQIIKEEWDALNTPA